MAFVPIEYTRLDRVTAQQMNYIQTQYQNCEAVRVVNELPEIEDSIEGEVLFVKADNKFYGFDGLEWSTLGDNKLPISDELPLLKNEIIPWKQARFDLSLISEPVTRVYYLPDYDGTFALLSNVPIITGEIPGGLLSRGEDAYHIISSTEILIGEKGSDPYIEITKIDTHTGDIIKYNESLNNARFTVKNDGKTVVKSLCVFSGSNG
jgi:hypothetical protein